MGRRAAICAIGDGKPGTQARPERFCAPTGCRFDYWKGVNMPRTSLWIFAAVGITLSGSMPVAAQEVQQSTAIVNRDVMNQISAFSYREGPESELLLTG